MDQLVFTVKLTPVIHHHYNIMATWASSMAGYTVYRVNEYFSDLHVQFELHVREDHQ